MTAISDQLDLGWRFDPSESRDARGQWAKDGEGYSPPDPARNISATRDPRAHANPADHPFFKANPVSAASVVSAWDGTSPEEKAQGMRWYHDAHSLALKMGNGNADKAAGVLAAYSPQTSWPVNMFNADRALDLGRAIGPGEGMITGAMQANAQKALDGQPADVANSSSKTQAFARLIRAGGDEPADRLGQVVIDRHAMTVAMGKRLSKKDADKAPIGIPRYYQHVADTYRDAAAQISSRGTPVTPHQVQAATWLRQQRLNEAGDQADNARLARGRVTSMKNAWAKWMAEATKDETPLVPGTTSLATITGQAIELRFDPLEARDSHGRWTRGGTAVAERVTHPIGEEGARGNSRAVSEDEFQRIAAEGRDRLRAIQGQHWKTSGLDQDWEAIKARTYAEVRKPWGGATVDPRTGRDLPQGADKYAMSVKPAGLDTTSVSEHASAAEFSQAMDIAKSKYGRQLAKGGSYLGIFHDDDLSRIDIDPVTVLDNLHDVETIGAWTHAIGGAYHFKSGDGFWPPHVASGAAMAAANPHWSGPGQWHSHAVSVQQPHDEPGDGGIAGQVELGWRDAWRTELRGPHGEWVHGAQAGEAIDEPRASSPDWTTPPDAPDYPQIQEAARGVAARMAPAVPRLLGGGTEAWNGKVRVFPKDDDPSTLALMQWTGRMDVQDELARGIREATSQAGIHKTVNDPGAFEVILHELIHGDIGGNDADTTAYDAALGIRDPGNPPKYSDNQVAYQDFTTAQIEEGFTELGAIHHAPEIFTALGIGSRPTRMASAQQDDPPPGEILRTRTRLDTMSEYARQLQDPVRINNGQSWGHYGWQTRMAQDWVQQIAMDEGHGDLRQGTPGYARTRELTDEINRQGAMNKMRAMAMQVVRTALKNTPEAPLLHDKDALLAVIHNTEKAIQETWAGEEAAKDAHRAAVKGARASAHTVAMARLAAERQAA